MLPSATMSHERLPVISMTYIKIAVEVKNDLIHSANISNSFWALRIIVQEGCRFFFIC